jgi:acetyl-CoA carboxylase biotin carboxyl carrier protein
VPTSVSAASAAVPTPVPAAAFATPAPPKNEAAPPPSKKLVDIKSPVVGTFYSAPNPGAEPFVRVGSRVGPTTVVCVIEAMKVFNEITADCSGVVAAVLADNQQAVEYNQVLFQVDPTG